MLNDFMVFCGNYQAADKRESCVCPFFQTTARYVALGIYWEREKREESLSFEKCLSEMAVIYSQALFFIKSYKQLQLPFK